MPHSQNGKRPDWANIEEKFEAKFDHLFDVGDVCFCGIPEVARVTRNGWLTTENSHSVFRY